MMVTDKADDEFIEAVVYPKRRPGEGYAFAEVGRRHGDFAIVACAAVVDGKRMRLAVAGVGDRPIARDFPLLEGRALDDALNDFAWALGAGDDVHATARYRRDLVRKLGREGSGGGRVMPQLSADRRHSVRFTLNGRPVLVEVEPRMLLTDALRHEIGATGTHVGCEHGVCGACTIADRRRTGTRLPDARGAGRRLRYPHRGGTGARAGPALGPAGGIPSPPCSAVRLLHRRAS